MSAKFRLAMTGLIVLSAFTGCSEEDTPSPPPSVVTVTETASPTPSSTAHPSASTKPKRAHSQAKFDHFMVTVDDLERVNSSEVRLLAKVCVRSLPPDPQGKRTRISWDPWSVRARAKMIDADPAHATFKGAFPADDIYRVGQCASGWIPFLARGSVTKIKYSNGVGDGAVWDADHLDRKPEIRAERSPTPQKSTPPTRGTFTRARSVRPRAPPVEPAPELRWSARASTAISHGGFGSKADQEPLSAACDAKAGNDQRYRDSGRGLDHEAQDTQDHRTVTARRRDRRHESRCSSFDRSARGKCGSN